MSEETEYLVELPDGSEVLVTAETPELAKLKVLPVEQAMTTTPTTIAVPDFTAKRLADKKRALLVLPMEPQPDKVEGGANAHQNDMLWWFGHMFYDNYLLFEELAPRRAGEAVQVETGEKCAHTGWPVTVLVTVVSVEAKRVRELTTEQLDSAGFDRQYAVTAPICDHPNCNGKHYGETWHLHDWWNEQHPAHPFDTAWAWLIGLTTKEN